VVETAHDRALSFDGGPMSFKWNDQIVGTTRDRAGQLGESGEYWMGRSMRGLFSSLEL
jgi:hypothetical protein